MEAARGVPGLAALLSGGSPGTRVRLQNLAANGSVACVAGLVTLLYSGVLAVYFGTGHDVWGIVLIGRVFAGHVPHAHPGTGYDGQWYYYLAQDPLHAAQHLDKPGYRYMRILYPLLAGAASLGRAVLVPYTLIAVNVLAVVGGTAAVALWLRRRGLSPWWALVYGLYPGLLLATWRDVAEPLAFGLIATGVLLRDRRLLWAAVCFGLAGLTRESTLVFPVIFAISGILTRPTKPRLRRTAAFLILSVGPLLLYKVVLVVLLGSGGVPPDAWPVLVPLQGLAAWWPWHGEQIEAALCIVAPAAICSVAVIRALSRMVSAPLLLLAVNLVLFVFLLNRESFGDIYGSLRVTTGVVLSALYCLPDFDSALPSRRWLWTSSGFWLALSPFLFLGAPLSMLMRPH